MNVLQDLSRELRQTVTDSPAGADDVVDVRGELFRLLQSEQWNSADWAQLDRIAGRLDITKKVLVAYTMEWKRTAAAELDASWRAVCAVVLCRAAVAEFEQDRSNPLALKRLNVAYKAIDYLAAMAPAEADRFSEAMKSANLAYEGQSTPPSETLALANSVEQLPLTVLFYEGPIARAYLETIASLGCKPRKIVQLISKVNLATGRENLRWLPSALRKPMAASMQYRQIFHWPQAIARQYPDDVAAVIRAVADSFEFSEATLQNAQTNKPLIEYSSNVETLLVENLKDPDLFDYLNAEVDREFLFTGGGIVPPDLLTIPGAKYIHVHPGYLPDIRGADGLLWSILSNGCPSASAFYMAPGIDTGEVIERRWLPLLNIPLQSADDVLTRYRMAYALVDPWVRCRVLREVLSSNTTFSNIDAFAQDELKGLTYHFMHERLRTMATARLFGGA